MSGSDTAAKFIASQKFASSFRDAFNDVSNNVRGIIIEFIYVLVFNPGETRCPPSSSSSLRTLS